MFVRDVAEIQSSHTTAVAIVIATSVKLKHVVDGSTRGSWNCFQPDYVLFPDMWRSVVARRLEAHAVDFETT